MRDHYFDRSRVFADWKCPRSRFWNYEYRGRGIVNLEWNYNLYVGALIHDVVADLADGIDIDSALTWRIAKFDQDMALASYEPLFAAEQSCLIEGMMRGFERHCWPLIIANRRVHVVEMETVIDLGDGVKFMVKPDLLLSDDLGNLYYWEYKSTSSNKEQWVNSWKLNPQLHVYAEALRRCGKSITSMTVQGLYKGWYDKKLKSPRQKSVFCYGYRRPGTKPFYTDEWLYEWKPGTKAAPIWEHEGGVKQWVEEMPKQILGAQFIASPPIAPDRGIAEAFFRQRKLRELEIANGRVELGHLDRYEEELEGATWHAERRHILDSVFPQHLDQCTPGWGSSCPYVPLCHGAEGIDPLTAGFGWRKPHHKPEMEQQKGEESD